MTSPSETQRKEILQATDSPLKRWEERRDSKESAAEDLIESATGDFNWLYQCTGEYHGNHTEL